METDIPPDLDAKLRFLQTHRTPRRILGHDTTFSDFTRKLGIKRETLRDAINRRVLTSALQTEIANKMQFGLNWSSWSEGSYSEFETQYIDAHNSKPQPNFERRVRVAAMNAPERCQIRGLASLELMATQFGTGSAFIGFELSCGRAFLADTLVTIKVGEISFDLGGARLDPETRKGRGAAFDVGDVRLQWNGGDSFQPAWRVESSNYTIGDLDIPHDFSRIINLFDGASITASFGIWCADIEEDIESEIPLLETSISLNQDIEKSISSGKLSVAKRKILIKIALEALDTKDNFIVLARHKIDFKDDS